MLRGQDASTQCCQKEGGSRDIGQDKDLQRPRGVRTLAFPTGVLRGKETGGKLTSSCRDGWLCHLSLAHRTNLPLRDLQAALKSQADTKKVSGTRQSEKVDWFSGQGGPPV